MTRASKKRLDMWFGITVFFMTWVACGIGCTTCAKKALASPSACESIHDADQRNLCRAETTGNKNFCESIKDHDLRQRCRAITEKKK